MHASTCERASRVTAVQVVEQARLRGIRVELEIDLPAHASSYCAGYPELCPDVPLYQNLTSPHDNGRRDPHCGPG